MQRFPHGAEGSSFFQKRVPDSAPEWLQTTIVRTPNGTTSRALVLADMAHVVWAVNLGCLGFHVWPNLADRRPRSPTSCASTSTRRPASASTRCAPRRSSCAACSTSSASIGYPKTTGNRGLHVYVRLEPRWDSYQVRSAAVAAARELERRRPELITAAWWKEERGERVFVDFNQNAPHKTVFGAWSVRARPGAQVSAPLRVGRARRDPPRRADDRDRPGAARGERRPVGRRWTSDPQSLEPLLELHERDRAAGLMDAPVAARLPEAAGRAAPRRAEPRAQEPRLAGAEARTPFSSPVKNSSVVFVFVCGSRREVEAAAFEVRARLDRGLERLGGQALRRELEHARPVGDQPQLHHHPASELAAPGRSA